ncbi:potassium channel family protein [Candidatus Magnetominusculus dajiuhuensis]|uniref:potassium channel family protein n=1 Tax=Candidatus Magnetominusculus dajiuhuensis TaxID=3137712 RepID=UPI003B4331EA
MKIQSHIDLRKKIIVLACLLIFIVSMGTAGYMVTEGWGAFDSFYMVVITLATIGYQEVHPMSVSGRSFTIVLIIFGVGALAYTVNTAMRIVLEGELQEVLGRRKMEKKIKAMTDHYIICGYGRLGQIICRELRSNDVPYVVIEKARPEEDTDSAELFLTGDATRDEVLIEAGIGRAAGLISVLSTDAQNLFVVLSARGLNPTLKIVARAGEESTESKLIRAGADRVVSPYHIGGLKMAQTILKPAVVDFLEFATKSGNIELQMEELTVTQGSEFANRTLSDLGIGRKFGVIIVAVKRSAGEMLFNPTHKSIVEPGDTLIALGEVSKLKNLEKMFRK